MASEFTEPKDQAEFRTGYSTVDHYHTINQVIKKCTEYNQPLYLAFIGYQKTCDSVEISTVKQALWNWGIDETYINILEEIHSCQSSIKKAIETR